MKKNLAKRQGDGNVAVAERPAMPPPTRPASTSWKPKTSWCSSAICRA